MVRDRDGQSLTLTLIRFPHFTCHSQVRAEIRVRVRVSIRVRVRWDYGHPVAAPMFLLVTLPAFPFRLHARTPGALFVEINSEAALLGDDSVCCFVVHRLHQHQHKLRSNSLIAVQLCFPFANPFPNTFCKVHQSSCLM